MKYMRESAGTPVPCVYALYAEMGKNYIMEQIHGKTLQDTWETLSESEKKTTLQSGSRDVCEIYAQFLHLTGFVVLTTNRYGTAYFAQMELLSVSDPSTRKRDLSTHLSRSTGHLKL